MGNYLSSTYPDPDHTTVPDPEEEDDNVSISSSQESLVNVYVGDGDVIKFVREVKHPSEEMTERVCEEEPDISTLPEVPSSSGAYAKDIEDTFLRNRICGIVEMEMNAGASGSWPSLKTIRNSYKNVAIKIRKAIDSEPNDSIREDYRKYYRFLVNTVLEKSLGIKDKKQSISVKDARTMLLDEIRNGVRIEDGDDTYIIKFPLDSLPVKGFLDRVLKIFCSEPPSAGGVSYRRKSRLLATNSRQSLFDAILADRLYTPAV